MATRFYLPSTGAAAVSPAFDASWEDTTLADSLRLLVRDEPTVPITALADKTSGAIPAVTADWLHRQYVSDPIIARQLSTSDTVRAILRCNESGSELNGSLRYVLRVVSNDGATFRGTLWTGTTTEISSGSSNTKIAGPTALSAVAAQTGDRLVLEVGVGVNPSLADRTFTCRFGNSASSDFAFTAGLTTDLNSWLELSCNLFTPDNNNYQFVKVGDGMGTGERIR